MDAKLVYRLVFQVPPIFALAAPTGRHQPCIHGCVVTLNTAGLVEVIGPSRWRVFEQASRFLALIGKGHEPVSLAATLYTPPPSPRAPGGRDQWSIVVGAKVAFAPTGMGAEIFDPVLEQAG